MPEAQGAPNAPGPPKVLNANAPGDRKTIVTQNLDGHQQFKPLAKKVDPATLPEDVSALDVENVPGYRTLNLAAIDAARTAAVNEISAREGGSPYHRGDSPSYAQTDTASAKIEGVKAGESRVDEIKREG